MSYYGAYETYNAIMGVVSILVSAISLVAYIFQSIGLYSIAKRRGIKAPGLAWVPVGSMWILGSIADQFDYVRTGQVKKKRVALLWLTLVAFILAIIVVPILVQLIANIVVYAAYGYGPEYIMQLVSPFMWVLLVIMALSIVSLIADIIMLICLYKLYKSCKPNSAVALIIFSIIFSIIIPFAIFALRKHDEGMYPEPVQPQRGYPTGPQYNQYMNQNQSNMNQPNMNQPNF